MTFRYSIIHQFFIMLKFRIHIAFIILFVLFNQFGVNAYGQDIQGDSIVRKSDLQFDNIGEKENFFNSSNIESSLMLLYCTNNYAFDLKKIEVFNRKIETTSIELQSSLLKIKKRDKQIQQIFTTVHQNHLTKYENQADFHELVDNGTYNCVTATLLYSMYLNRLNVPYAIKETPQHVYLVSYPKDEQILIESTDPAKGYMLFNDAYKTLFVQNLRKSKIISEQEFKASNTTALFDKYYYSDKNINQSELISIHYTNNAIMQLEKENYREFLNQMKKAYFLSPSAKNQSLLFMSSLLVLQSVTYDNNDQITDLLFLSRFIDKGITITEIRDEFSRITYLYLVNTNRQQEYDAIYARFDSAIVNDELRREIGFLYNYEKGRNALIKARYSAAYPFVKAAFELNEDHSDAQVNLISNLASLIDQEKSRLNLKLEMDTLSTNHKVILENNNFVQLYKISYLACIEELYKAGKPNDGNQLITDFETLDRSYPTIKVGDDVIGRAYSEAAVYYFKNGNKAKCRDLLSRGLSLAPASQELKTRKLMLNY
jgi:hypothetical protein